MNWNQLQESTIDILIAVCGYECRATHVPLAIKGRVGSTIILDYESTDVLSYNSNKEHLGKFDAVTFLSLQRSLYIPDFESCVGHVISAIEAPKKLNVVFDVSCGSRRLISQILIALDRVCRERLNLFCVYSVSEFYDPPSDELPSHISEPVVGALSGWSEDLSQPPCAVIGLGFEPGRAIGCLDYLEIPEVRLLQPFGPDPRFIEAVEKANRQLIQEAGSGYLLPYSVMNPVDTYLKLESMVFGLRRQFRPILLPLGPKIFAVACIVLAIRYSPHVCVWRTSSGNLGAPHDTRADGNVAVFHIGSLERTSTDFE